MNKELFADIPNVGKLYYHNIYLFYDEPQIFSCIDLNNKYYFLLSIPSEEKKSSWLLVPVTTGRLLRLEKNTFQIRNAFLNPEKNLYRLDEVENTYNCEVIKPIELTDDLLPEKNTFLDFSPTQETVDTDSNRQKNIVLTVINGRLVGINILKKRFEFISEDGTNIKGFLSDDILNNTFSIPNYVSAQIEIIFKNNKPNKYTLVRI